MPRSAFVSFQFSVSFSFIVHHSSTNSLDRHMPFFPLHHKRNSQQRTRSKNPTQSQFSAFLLHVFDIYQDQSPLPNRTRHLIFFKSHNFQFSLPMKYCHISMYYLLMTFPTTFHSHHNPSTALSFTFPLFLFSLFFSAFPLHIFCLWPWSICVGLSVHLNV